MSPNLNAHGGCETCFAREFYNYDDSVPYQTDHDIAFIVLTLA